jgi:alkaline phosphatase D
VDPSFDWTDQPLVRDTILAHYHYNWQDEHVQNFLGSISTYAQWDDHEVIDDFGAQWEFLNPLDMRPGFPILVQEGLSAFLNYWPIEPNPDEPQRIYRSFRWGKNVELFLLDARSYRSRNDLADIPENDKTLLGKAQLAWLKEGLANSTATWKIVANDCPLAAWRDRPPYPIIGQDCWAHGTSQTGFTRELVDLMTFLDSRNVKNMVWLATDIHAIYSTRFAFDGDGDGRSMVFHEFIVGPLSAVRSALTPFDNTLNPEPLFRTQGIFNFGHFRVERREDGYSHFIAEARHENGDVVPGSVRDLVAEEE